MGEFISPGYDCSDILNKKKNAEDGFYWIHLNETIPKKVRILISFIFMYLQNTIARE